MDTMLQVEVKTEDISQRLSDEEAKSEKMFHWLKYEDIARLTREWL
jgi:hypothetical protein